MPATIINSTTSESLMQISHFLMKAWGGNLHSAKGPGGQSQGVPAGFLVRFSESGEGARGLEGGGCLRGPMGFTHAVGLTEICSTNLSRAREAKSV